MTARNQARQWLAEVHAATDCDHGHYGSYPCTECTADAILDAPGVTIEEIRGVIAISDGTVHPVLGPPGRDWATSSQVVIRLPAVPLDTIPAQGQP